LVLISILGWTILTHVLYGQERQSAKPNPSDSNTEELQKATQNPVASLISVPFQNNTDLNIGPFARDKSTLNVQPVIPMKLNESWNLIARIITPLLFHPMSVKLTWERLDLETFSRHSFFRRRSLTS